MPELVGYARVSTGSQEFSFEAQKELLEEVGCTKVFSEMVSAVATERPEFAQALKYLRPGDTLVVTRLDRLARSLPDLMQIQEHLFSRGIEYRVLDLGIDTGTPHGRMLVGIIGSVSEFERSLLLERQRIGIDKAKAAGKYKGRKPKAMMQADQVKALAAEGHGKTEIARRLNMSRSSIYRALGKPKEGC